VGDEMREIEKLAITVLGCGRSASKVMVNYDRLEDVLYLNYLNSDPQKADFGTKVGDYILRFKRNVIVGVTVLNAKEHFRKQFSDVPDILTVKCVA
jgi:hypothetical protein